MYVYIVYVTEDCIAHNLMSRGLDTQGYTILRNVFKHEQEKNIKERGQGWGWVLGVIESQNFYYSPGNSWCAVFFSRPSGEDTLEAR